MDRFEQINEVPDEESQDVAEVPDGKEDDTLDEQNSDQTSSGDDDDDDDESDDTESQDIVTDVRELLKRDKIDVLTEVIKCRTEMLRLRKQIEVYQYALEQVGGEKTRLQLDLALTTKTLLVLKEALTEQHKQDEKILQQINTTSDFIGDLDLKRVQLIKEIRQLTAKFDNDKGKLEAIVKERTQEEANRCRQLQEQIDSMTATNNDLNQQLVEANVAYQSLTSAHSEHLNELAKLNDELQEAQKCIANEVQSNTTLKENVEMLLAEKTQQATTIIQLENRMAELEQQKDAKLAHLEQSSNSKLLKLEQQNDAMLKELEDAWKGRYEQEIKKIDVMLTDLKAENEEANKQNAILNTTIMKLREELQALNKKLEQEKEQEKNMDTKIGEMQTMLEDRNNKVCSLNAKLISEQTRWEEQKRQFEQTFTELEGKLKITQEAADIKASNLEGQLKRAQEEVEMHKTKNEKLVQDLANHTSKISALKSTILQKDKEHTALKGKLANVEKAHTSSPEVPPKANKQEDIRTNTENTNNQSSAQITSTPICRLSNLTDSLDISSSKKVRTSDTDSSVSNYTSFQGRVDRKRDANRFFRLTSVTDDKKAAKDNSETDLISLNSTVNLDEEPLEALSTSNSDSPISLVKPFFRRQPEKK